jgi:hypothetical protein
MIGYIKIILTDQPGIFTAGSQVVMYAPGDPVPTGLQISETITAARHRVVTGEDNLHLQRVVQKIAYNRYKLKVFARPSDNAGLLHSGRYIAVYLPDGSIHRGEVLEFDDKQAGSINARMIDISYIDTNQDNYGAEPVNNYLTHSAIVARIAAGQLSAANTVRLVWVVPPTTQGTVFYSVLRPTASLSDPSFPEEDEVSGVMRPNATVAQEQYSAVFYANEATALLMQQEFTLSGHISDRVHRLIIPGATLAVAVQAPAISVESIPEAADLYRVDVNFKYNNNYIYNY